MIRIYNHTILSVLILALCKLIKMISIELIKIASKIIITENKEFKLIRIHTIFKVCQNIMITIKSLIVIIGKITKDRAVIEQIDQLVKIVIIKIEEKLVNLCRQVNKEIMKKTQIIYKIVIMIALYMIRDVLYRED